MVEYNKANAKLLDSQLNKLKCAIDAGIQKKIHVSETTTFNNYKQRNGRNLEEQKGGLI